ncbi:RelA/SpoT family protein [uncultured Capnocytophaga sp.]|jgi:relA/spoT family protein|uniref:RelA/SpoT family protein n=1 Tax=uncultured Capnocytophaga sp. TaxID=159273 RepID=UPI0028E34590|nr:RelA/SpoT family protein [uncultured Capnocytophaga sp.]
METEYYTAQESKDIAQAYKELLRVSYQALSDEDKKLIRKAFDMAVDAHKEQRRKSGEPYIFHPIAVAKIVAQNIGLDATSIAAALLHDVVEDTPITIENIAEIFGDTIAKIVKGLTKISDLSRDTDVSFQAENFRKMLLTLNDDVRVILIKIADRLHNMQTMDSMPSYKQQKIASETLFIYAPLAHRVGLYNIKTELEDLGLKYTEPEQYYEIFSKIEGSKEEQMRYIEEFSNTVKVALDKEKIEYYIKGRPKSIYSIYKKMTSKKIPFEEVYDKFAIRIIYKSDPDNEKFLAWKIYSIVTDYFRPNPTRLRDWLSSPKSTGYEALHITVVGPQNKWVEVQIRSERMHEIAEKGYAAHFKYKHGEQKERGIEQWLNRLQEVLENNEANAVEFVQEFKMNLYADEIFIFTPNGEIKSLPKGATPLDFAFSIHTEVGMHTRGAKVNGKLVPLNYKLRSGEQVEIITAENAIPNPNWLDYATTTKAIAKIKGALKENRKKIAEEGKEVLRRKLKQLKITLDEKVTNDLVTFFKTKTSQDIFYQMATGEINNQMLKNFVSSRSTSIFNFFRKKAATYTAPEKAKESHQYDMIVFGKDEQVLDYSFSKCCTPIPGDEIFGYIAVNGGSIKVHKKDCPNALSMFSNFAYRITPAKWVKSTEREFETTIKIIGVDRKGLAAEIANYITHNGLGMNNIQLTSKAGIFEGEITLLVSNTESLNSLLEGLRKLNGVEKVFRE